MQRTASELVLRGMMESQEMVIFALGTDYEYLAFNGLHFATMKRIWGVEIQEGTSMLQYIGRHDDLVKARDNFDRALAGEHFTLTEAYGSETQERRVYENRYSPIFDDRGIVVGLTVFVSDVTGRVNKDRELKMYREHLEEAIEKRTQLLKDAELELHQSEKLKSLGAMAGGIAHDFNNLLTGILGCAELASSEVEGSEAFITEMLDEIVKAARQGASLTSQMLAYSSQDSLQESVFDLNTVVTETEGLLRVIVGDRASVDFELGRGDIALKGDEGQLHQVVLNVVKNASEAIEQGTGGAIVIRTSRIDARELSVGTARVIGTLPTSGNYVCLDIQDNGSGMDTQTARRVFEPFYSRRRGGRGLGMSAVLGIIQRHAGVVLLDTAVSEGTRFRFLIPAAAQEAEGAKETKVRNLDEIARANEDRVLIVDDDDAVRGVLVRMVKRLGFAPEAVASGLEAIEHFERDKGGIQCILMDLSMPNMSGAETILELRKRGATAPVIAMSGYAPEGILVREVRREIDGFIAKPFELLKLSDAVASVVPSYASGRGVQAV